MLGDIPAALNAMVAADPEVGCASHAPPELTEDSIWNELAVNVPAANSESFQAARVSVHPTPRTRPPAKMARTRRKRWRPLSGRRVALRPVIAAGQEVDAAANCHVAVPFCPWTKPAAAVTLKQRKTASPGSLAGLPALSVNVTPLNAPSRAVPAGTN